MDAFFVIFIVAGSIVLAFYFGRMTQLSRRRLMDDPIECRKMVDHYQRLYDNSITHIRTMYDVNDNLARQLFGHDTAEEAIDGDGVHQDFRDSLGFWRIQIEDAERRLTKS